MNSPDLFGQGNPNKSKQKHNRNIDSRTRKIIVAGAVGVLVWEALSLIGPQENIVPSPLQTVGFAGDVIDGVGTGAKWSQDKLESIGETDNDNVTMSTTLESTTTIPTTTSVPNQDNIVEITLPTVNVPNPTIVQSPATSESSQSTNTHAINNDFELPNPMTYSVAAGGVSCNGAQITAIIDLSDSRPAAPLTQLDNQTNNEGWDDSSINPNPLDDALFSEVMSTAMPLGNEQFQVFVRLGCTGLSQ